MRLRRRILNTLDGRLTLAFVLMVMLSIGAVFGIWRLYRASTFEAAMSELLAAQVRTVLALANAFGGDDARLGAALAASGLKVGIDEPSETGGPPRAPLIEAIETRASALVGRPIELRVRYLPPREATARFDWHGRPLTLHLPLGQWESGLPTPVLLWLGLVIVLSALAAALAVRLLQRPLARLADDIARQRDRLAPLDMPARATAEVTAVAAAYNRVVEEIARRDREREVLLAGVSHDLRAPLARLRMRALSVDDERVADGIVRDVESLDRIVGQFLAFVRSGAESGDTEARSDPVGIAHLVAERSASVERQVAVAGTAPAVRGDPATLERILVNLVDNAFEYGAPPVEIRLSSNAGQARIVVVDAGGGLPPEQFARAAEPFVRLDPARGSAGHCGLGLAIVSRLAVAAGGRLIGGPEPGGFGIGVELPLASPA